MRLLLQFYLDQFETLQALMSWSVDVHVVLALLSLKFLSLFLTFELIYFSPSICYILHPVING